MIVAVWNMGRVADNLLQIKKNGRREGLNLSTISIGGFQSILMYVEISKAEDLSLRMNEYHGLVARI